MLVQVVLCQAVIARAVSAAPVARWPASFSAAFLESTWYRGGAQTHSGTVSYLWNGTSAVQVIRRENSTLNPICAEVRPGRTTPCTHYAPDGASRYLLWPEDGECCLHCTKDCG